MCLLFYRRSPGGLEEKCLPEILEKAYLSLSRSQILCSLEGIQDLFVKVWVRIG